MKFYYENALSSQNVTAKTNVVWVTDVMEIELNQQKKLYMFLCLDVHTNKFILSYYGTTHS
jgi:hypothetical protein